ncbi:hypothetical protein LTR84_004789 [Exophiala bonariae]|uniref:Xylanolytic transcriptional activator regulatory domain-containing protein n=1 Tax=Exophiala bonariae TaxID=1690606 RepID=A0AAV9NRY4_9EURO|nr:hypothetical protein LTR84_004789 [Exophiala bonariae]
MQQLHGGSPAEHQRSSGADAVVVAAAPQAIAQPMSPSKTRPSKIGVLRRPSMNPPEAFAEGHHIGPSSGVSFLYHSWNKGEKSERDAAALPSAPLISHGDMPLPKFPDQGLPSREEADSLLELYFRFGTPTYRFLHLSTVQGWAFHLLNGDPQLMSETACVLLAFAQSLLYTKAGDRYASADDRDFQRSAFYSERAKSLLTQESGPASLSSVQARLALCLHLLSTFRINECRFTLNMACAILTSIGLHRRTRNEASMDLITIELRKRTFWCAYVLDGYLSVMLGCPRMLRDQDIDQDFPRNIDDQDLLSAESPEELPLHGNLEAFIAHAELAKLMGRNSDLLYPLQPLTEDQVLERTSNMLDSLLTWREKLPEFLKPREKTLSGQRTFERQNTVLKFAFSHMQILVTRRSLLADFSNLGGSVPAIRDERALRHIQQCADAIDRILSTACDMIDRTVWYQGFWFTPYVALVALSTLYVFLIQKSRSSLPATSFPQVENLLEKARRCQDFLTALSPKGSQARRHYELLDRLRCRAEKDALKARLVAPRVIPTTTGVASTPSAPQVSSSEVQHVPPDHNARLNDHAGIKIPQISSVGNIEDAHNVDSVGVTTQFTPSEDDFVFQNLLKWDWEHLDTVGFPGDWEPFNLPS